MQRSLILSIAFSFLCVACVRNLPPDKPTLEACVLDIDRALCTCGVKAPNKPVSQLKHLPLLYCDKATVFIPDEWEKYKNYVDGLEAYVERQQHQTQ